MKRVCHTIKSIETSEEIKKSSHHMSPYQRKMSSESYNYHFDHNKKYIFRFIADRYDLYSHDMVWIQKLVLPYLERGTRGR